MPWKLWRSWLRKPRPAGNSRPRRNLHRFQPALESLEARTTPTVFSNPTPIRIVDGAPGDPYPSTINVAGLNGPLANLTVTLSKVIDDFAEDIDVLLVGPQGQSLILIGDAGLGGNNQVTIIFDDNGSVIGANDSGWANGAANTTVTRVPINYTPADAFPAPAPNPPYTDPGPSPSGATVLASTFAGTNPNGSWRLFVVDDSLGSGELDGVIQGGWSLDITIYGPDLQITKDDQLTQAAPGQTITYTITVSNPGPLGSVGASVTDVFPAQLRGVTYTATATGGATGFTASGTGDINDVVDMPAQSSITYKARGTIDPAAAEGISNAASVNPPAGVVDPDPTNNTATDSDILSPAADVAVGMSAVAGKRRIVYTVTVRNLGPSDAENVVLADLLPPQTLFIAQVQTSGPSFTLSNTGNQIRNTIDVLPGGAAATFRVFVRAPRGCCVVNVANVTTETFDPQSGNNAITLTTFVGNNNQRWLAQVYRDLLKQEIGDAGLKNGEAFLKQPGNPRRLRLQYMQKLLKSLHYFARISHDTFKNLLNEPNHHDDCVKALDFLNRDGTREQLHAKVYGDREYFVKRGGGTKAGWAAAVFQDIFGRPIDAAGAALIHRLLAKGLSRQAVAQQLLNSLEARAHLVNGWFHQFLERDPKQAELTRFVKDLGRGVSDEQIIAIILASPEYFQKTCAPSEPEHEHAGAV